MGLHNLQTYSPWLCLVFLQDCPEHVVGRVGQAIGHLYNRAPKQALAVLTPVPQVLGPVGIFRLLVGITTVFLRAQEQAEKA